MKKIKPVLKKTKVKGTPSIGIFLHAHLRHKLAKLTAQWYRFLQETLGDELNLRLYFCGVSDQNYDHIAKNEGFTRLLATRGLTLGAQLNEGLGQLKSDDLHAVIPVAAGDFLTASLIRQYAKNLQEGSLFNGLLDQYIYDPNELKCVHWSRGEVKEGLERTCELGLLISRPMLDQLKWQLWPSQSSKGLDALHSNVMERMGKIFSFAPPKTCLLQSMETYGGKAFTFKSELGRALFDESNWQLSLGLSHVDFELAFESELSEEWIKKIDLFDERVTLDVIVEAPKPGAAHESLWREHYEFLPYKFDPFASVRLRVIPHGQQTDSDLNYPWQVTQVEPDESRSNRWNRAVNDALSEGSDAILFGGIGSLVDLKTIEHYLIYLTKEDAKLLSTSNFFVAMEDGHQGYFWPGIEGLGFTRSLGFGSCVHREHLERLGAEIFSDQGLLTTSAQEQFDLILGDSDNKHQRVMFQLVRHQLGLIAFETDGAYGFTDLIRLAALKTVNVSQHLHVSSFRHAQFEMLERWERRESLKFNPLMFVDSPTDIPHSTSSGEPNSEFKTMTNNESTHTMSPLERAKALLQQAKSTSDPQEVSTATQNAGSAGVQEEAPQSAMSPLERAKALLKTSRSAEASPASEEANDTSNSSAQPMSALERAKALLQSSVPISDSSTNQPKSVEASSPEPMSALQRAKALLQSANQGSSESVEPQQSIQDETKNLIANALQGAEAMVNKLQATAEAARAQVASEKQNLTQLAEETGAPSPAMLLCERGEAAFESGDESQATTLFDSALLVEPTCVRALNNLGVMALQTDEPWRALSYLLMGVIQDPQNEDLVINLQGLFDLYPELKTVRSVIFD